MEAAALGIAVLALLVALVALGRAGGSKARIEEAEAEARRRVENLGEELRAKEGQLREMVALLAEGAALDGDMVREGRTWRDVSPAEGVELVAAGEIRLIDVRTPQETAGGIIPGATLIPVDELEARKSEIPRDGKPTLIYCAGGGRSAAACEFLAAEGYTGLANLDGGFGSWTGPRETPA